MCYRASKVVLFSKLFELNKAMEEGTFHQILALYQHKKHSLFGFVSDFVKLTTAPLGPAYDRALKDFITQYTGDDFKDSSPDYDKFFTLSSHSASDMIAR